MRGMAHAIRRLYIYPRRGCEVRQETCIPGALSILTGAVPERARGLVHTAPTYVVGLRDRPSTGRRGFVT